MEVLICARRQSVCYRDGEIFRKYFKYADRATAEREGHYSEVFERMGISTPHFIKTARGESLNFFCNEYVFVEIIPLTERIMTAQTFDDIINVIEKIQSMTLIEQTGKNYWHNGYKNNLKDALKIFEGYTGLNFNRQLEKTFDEPISNPMHGDFSLSNMGLTADGELIVFDFQMSGCGPKYWDLAYLIGSSSIELGRKLYLRFPSVDILDHIKLVTAVRLGRSFRKREDIARRIDIFNHWNGCNYDYDIDGRE